MNFSAYDGLIKLQELFNKIPAIKHFEVIEETGKGFSVALFTTARKSKILNVRVLQRAVPKIVSDEIIKNQILEKYLIIMAPYVSDDSAAICEKAGVGYCDFSGNCLISIDTIYLSVKGMPNKYPKQDYAKKLFRSSAVTTSFILRELIRNGSKNWKIKELSETVGCSIGMVSRVKTFLCEQRWAEMGSNGLRLTDPESLLRAWSEDYYIDTVIHCYTKDLLPVFERKSFDFCIQEGRQVCLTGFSGGVRYAPVVRYTKAHVWIRKRDISAFFQYTGCKEVDSGSNVDIFVARNEDVFADCREINRSFVVSPVQAYLDCMQLKGRGEEIAKEIFNKEIAQFYDS